ncbi:unnamed protein product [Ectocarpus sp. CCAP 1310/34]|nr:unnamed protein product [Ectocarpus sp. CCAP 1310/34]
MSTRCLLGCFFLQAAPCVARIFWGLLLSRMRVLDASIGQAHSWRCNITENAS